MVLLRFIGSTPGRVVRVAAGLAFIGVGLAAGGGWVVLSGVGLVPLAAGAFDFCLLGPLVRLPIAGNAFRDRCNLT